MYTKKKCKIYVLSVLLCTFFFSCSSIDFELPQGPQGTNGKSAYEIWKEEVETGHINWPSTQVDLADFLVYIKGEKGDKGKDGMSAYDQWKILITQGNVTNPHDPSLIWPSSKNTEADFWDFLSGRDGESPHIGENGNWYIGNKDTKIKVYPGQADTLYQRVIARFLQEEKDVTQIKEDWFKIQPKLVIFGAGHVAIQLLSLIHI